MLNIMNSKYYNTLSNNVKDKARKSGFVFQSEDELREYIDFFEKPKG